MCGRFTLRTPMSVLTQQFLFEPPDHTPLTARYNVAPTQNIAAVRGHSGGGRELAFLRWGLIPRWAKEKSIGNRMINARGETVHSKPSFRHAFRHQRCLVLADGFYEWKKEGSRKQPYHITLANDEPFAFAGLWERWSGVEPAMESCTIITTPANEAMQAVHERMPVILSDADYAAWLDPEFQDVDQLRAMFVRAAAPRLQMKAVSTLVNSPRHDTPECLEPVGTR